MEILISRLDKLIAIIEMININKHLSFIYLRFTHIALTEWNRMCLIEEDRNWHANIA